MRLSKNAVSKITNLGVFFVSSVILFSLSCDLNLLPEKPHNPPDPLLSLTANPRQLCDNLLYADSCKVQVTISLTKAGLEEGHSIYLGYQFENTDDWFIAHRLSEIQIGTPRDLMLRLRRRNRCADDNGLAIYNGTTVRLVAFVSNRNDLASNRCFQPENFGTASPVVSISLSTALDEPLMQSSDIGTAKDFEISIPQSALLAAVGNKIQVVDLRSPNAAAPDFDFGGEVDDFALVPNGTIGLACISNKKELRKFIFANQTVRLLADSIESNPPMKHVAITARGDWAYAIAPGEGEMVYLIHSLGNNERLSWKKCAFGIINPIHVATGGSSSRGFILNENAIFVVDTGCVVQNEIMLGHDYIGGKIAVAADESFAVVSFKKRGQKNLTSVLYVDPNFGNAPTDSLILGDEIQGFAISADQRYVLVTNVKFEPQKNLIAVVELDHAAKRFGKSEIIQIAPSSNSYLPRLAVSNYVFAYIVSRGNPQINRIRFDLLGSGARNMPGNMAIH